MTAILLALRTHKPTTRYTKSRDGIRETRGERRDAGADLVSRRSLQLSVKKSSLKMIVVYVFAAHANNPIDGNVAPPAYLHELSFSVFGGNLNGSSGARCHVSCKDMARMTIMQKLRRSALNYFFPDTFLDRCIHRRTGQVPIGYATKARASSGGVS
jgi:hypothetical protein